MKKTLALLIMMSLLSVSCNKTGDGTIDDPTTTTPPASEDPGTPKPDPTPTPVPKPVPVPVPKPTPGPVTGVPPEALTFDSNITLVNFTPAQAEKYNKAIEIVKMVVATEAFRTKVLSFTYNGQTAYADNRSRTNAQIYQSILDAAETLQPAKNNTMDLEVELYYAANSVVGYTNGGTKRIWVNTKFFNTYQANSVSGNLFHEWLHKLGYGHDSAATAKRPYSVPYAIGYIMSGLGKNFL